MQVLPAMDVGGRIERVRATLHDEKLDALLLTNLTNIRYLTGFSGSAGMLLVKTDECVLITDGRYAEQSSDQLAAAGVEASIKIGNQPAQREHARRSLATSSRIGLEAEHVSWSRQRQFAEWFDHSELVPTEAAVERLRRTKDDGEVARIAAACALADVALAALQPAVQAGVSERDLAAELDFHMLRAGADGVSFDTIFAAGPNGAKPHAAPSDRPLEPGDLVVIDFGALVDGYHSDMTRTIAVGEPAEATMRRMFAVVLEAQQAGLAAVRDGVEARAVDAACRDVIAAAGWGEAFVHSTGHGVGLDIHEYPLLGTTSDAVLQTGQVVTVEPGVYLPAYGGVRIEDTVAVTENGYRPLTHSPKELVIA